VILLDTHTLVWMDQDDQRLGQQARNLISAHFQTGEIAVSAISFWECALLQARKRLDLPSSVNQWRSELLDNGLLEIPLDGHIAILSVQLELLHKDPADRFIAATAIRHDATLITADEKLLAAPPRLKRLDARS
jgi:PIN domain nuclease of toxin-antitoxin system